MNMIMNMVLVDTENPTEHWKYVDVKDKIVLDLGCGRWEKIETRDPNWPTTPEYLINEGASKVFAVDIDQQEIDWFTERFKGEPKYHFLCRKIASIEEAESIIRETSPDCIKCDIEENEQFLFKIDRDLFRSVKEYYIETHGADLFQEAINTLSRHEYHIRKIINLTHTKNHCKVIFASRVQE